MHGGSLTHVKEAAARRAVWEAAEGGVAQLLRECDLPEQHPIDGLLEVVRHSGAMMRLLGFMVSELDTHKESGEHKYGLDAIIGFDSVMEQAQNIYVKMYGEWADRYARACKLALDANIDERLVRNAEATTGVFLEALEEALKDAKLEPTQAAAFTKSLATRLRKLAGPIDRNSLI